MSRGAITRVSMAGKGKEQWTFLHVDLYWGSILSMYFLNLVMDELNNSKQDAIVGSGLALS